MDQWQGYDKKTTKMYLRMIKHFIGWIEKEKDITSNGPQVITAGLVRDYRTYLALIEQKKPSTINKFLQVLRIYCRWAMEEGHIQTNPALRISYIEEPLLAPRSLNESYVDILRLAIEKKDLKTKAIIELGLSAGLRISETVNLKVSNLSLKKRGEVFVRASKGFKFRTIPIAQDLIIILKEYLKTRKHQSEYLFVSDRYGKKMSPRAIQKIVGKIRNELPFDFTYHTLRHTYCSDLLNSGMALTDVAIIAGHVKKNGMPNITTTARYVMSHPDKLAKAVRKMARWRNKRQIVSLN